VSDHKPDTTSLPTGADAHAATHANDARVEPLAGLMAPDAGPVAGVAAPDLDAEALAAAEHALAEGERSLAAARAQLRDVTAPPPPTARRRELLLRVLLAANVVAMVVVAMLPPARRAADDVPAPPPTPATDDATLRRFNEPFNNALVAADRGRFPEAVAILEQYLRESPHLVASQQLNVLNMLSHYAGLANDWTKAQQYAQRAAAIGQSHSLPADLVAMAKAALAQNDQETLRRVWARFLLQQRQVPSWLYKHVAEAYLQLGDSYRQQANDAAERARVRELEQNAERLRAEATRAPEVK
jgi:tetratricopeptide (TPR) repeat protein